MSASESAFFSLSPAQLDRMEMEQEGVPTYGLALRMLANDNRLLATILIGNNFVNVGIVMVSNHIADSVVTFVDAPAAEFMVKVVLITFLLLLFCEIMPKNVGMALSLDYVRRMGGLLYGVYRVLGPFARPLSRMVANMNRHFTPRSSISMDDLGQALEITQEQIEEEPILRRIVQFGQIEASEIMRPRIDVVGVDVEEGFDELRRIVLESGYSRIPAYRDTLDTVEGILYVKDLLPYLDESDDFDWVKLLRGVYYVPENKRINSLLRDFQEDQVHMAIVVDEYGGTSGILTLEDVMEEVFGEIGDESDAESRLYSIVGDGVYRVDAKIQLNDLCKLLSYEDDSVFDAQRGEAETLAGLILELLGRFPRMGEVLHVGDLTLTVEKVGARRIESVRLERVALG